MRSVQRVAGGVIPDESSDESTWEVGINMTAMEHPSRGGWALDFQDELPGKGRPTVLESFLINFR